MPDRRRHRTTSVSPAWIVLAAVMALGVAAPVVVLAGGPSRAGAVAAADAGNGIPALAPPPETCRPDETRAAGGVSNICGGDAGSDGGGGFNVGALLPILGVVAVGGAILLVAAFVILRRTSKPLVPADPGEWWTCRTCGKANVVGSARCYACGAWQR
jgi:hypothetical protein